MEERKGMNIPALKAALEQSSSPSMDPAQFLYRHTYPGGRQEHITFYRAAEAALDRINALELELAAIFTDPDIKHIREAKRNRGR